VPQDSCAGFENSAARDPVARFLPSPHAGAREALAHLPEPKDADVALALGCRIDAFVPEAAIDAVAVLDACGVRVGLARKPVCSGFLQEAWGASEDATACADEARRASEGKPTATLCGGCRNAGRSGSAPRASTT
jgi:Fe-S oxidoreductase